MRCRRSPIRTLRVKINWRRIWTERGRRTKKAVWHFRRRRKGPRMIESRQKRNKRRTDERRMKLRGERRILCEISRRNKCWRKIKRGKSENDSNGKRERLNAAPKPNSSKSGSDYGG